MNRIILVGGYVFFLFLFFKGGRWVKSTSLKPICYLFSINRYI